MESSTPRLLLRYIRRNMLKKVVNEVKATTFRYYSRAKLRVMALKKLVLSKFYAGRVRLSENLLESIVLYCTVELLKTVHALARKTCYTENAYVCQLVFC